MKGNLICVALSGALIVSSIKLSAQHSGPNYGSLPSGTYMDNNSQTLDNARGGYTVTWTDRYNKVHKVIAPEHGSITVAFPIPYGGSWYWIQGDGSRERTGFNAAVTWVEATFWREGNYVRMQSTGHIVNGTKPDGGILRDLNSRVKDLGEIINIGARTYDEGIRIATAAGQLK